MTWEQIDWAALERLRGLFLSGEAARAPYWRSASDLASYDFTYGARIGWKWDAVLRELDGRAWRPPAHTMPKLEHGSGQGPTSTQTTLKLEHGSGQGPERPWTVLDWGCGSGVAGRRVVRWLGPDRVAALRLWDESALAADFAAAAARAEFAGVRVEHLTPGFFAGGEPAGVLVVSHVLTELPAAELAALVELAGRADAVLWVAPGTAAASRALIAVREQLRGRFRLVAPCTHQAACGLLAPANARHWCHHFAAPPPGIFVDANWAQFGRRAGIDLRSLPYSFLALARADGAPAADPAAGFERVIGEPRFAKGIARVLSCGVAGVGELTIQKRDAPDLLRELKRPPGPLVYRWTRPGDRIQAGERLAAGATPAGG